MPRTSLIEQYRKSPENFFVKNAKKLVKAESVKFVVAFDTEKAENKIKFAIVYKDLFFAESIRLLTGMIEKNSVLISHDALIFQSEKPINTAFNTQKESV